MRKMYYYQFMYKDEKGIVGNKVISVDQKDNELAIAKFEKLFPDIVWRSFISVEAPQNDTTDYKQIAFKLKGDLETKEWEYAHVNLPFLQEMKERLIKGEKDPTQREYVMNMVDDWIKELQEILDK